MRLNPVPFWTDPFPPFRVLRHREAKNLEIFIEVLERPWSLGDS